MSKNRLKIKTRDLFWTIIFTVFLFQNVLNTRISFLRYTDEVFTIYFGLYTVIYLLKKKTITRPYTRMYALMGLLCIIGIASNVTSGVSRTPFMIALDIMYLFKVFVCFIGASLYFSNPKRNGKLLNIMAGEVRAIVLIAFTCLIISQFIDIGMTRGVRYGFKCFLFVYSSAGMFSQYCIIFLVILTAELAVHKRTIQEIIFFTMLIAIWASTGRSRGFAVIVVWLFICFISRGIDRLLVFRENALVKKIFRPQYIVVIISVTILLGSSQLSKYFGDEVVSARSLLVSGGIRIMMDFFPLGSGFGTFGTETAATYYSPLYHQYGLSSFWALAENGSELTDCYWPAICAELGVIGIILMAALIYMFIKQYYGQSKCSKYFILSAITYIIYMLISSTATGIFSSYITAEFIIICVAIMTTSKNLRRTS